MLNELVRLLDIVDPNFETGRVTLISRYGADKVEKLLPPHIAAVQKSKHKVVWVSDPAMVEHQNLSSNKGQDQIL